MGMVVGVGLWMWKEGDLVDIKVRIVEYLCKLEVIF